MLRNWPATVMFRKLGAYKVTYKNPYLVPTIYELSTDAWAYFHTFIIYENTTLMSCILFAIVFNNAVKSLFHWFEKCSTLIVRNAQWLFLFFFMCRLNILRTVKVGRWFLS